MTAVSPASERLAASRLKPRTLAAYGQIALPLAIADLPLVIYLTAFYADLGVGLQAMAWVLLIARLADFLIDPAIGMASDRSGAWSIGRRKGWVMLGVPVMMLGTYMLFFAVQGVSPGYMLGWLVVFYLGWTMVQIPYGAWGAEISGDYHERTRVTGWRTFFAFIGILIATLAPVITGGGQGQPDGQTPVMNGLGLWVIVLLPLSALLIWRFVPDTRPRHAGAELSWLAGMKLAAKNGPFMRILIATTIGRIGAAINSTVIIWFFFFALGLGASAGLPVLVYLLAAVFGVPVWVALGNRFSKHNALIVAVLSSLAAFVFLLIVPQGDVGLACIIMILAGLGGGAAATLGLSIAGDVIDLDELRARRSRAGLLVAFWNMGSKFADAIGGFLALMILSYFGFDAKSLTNTPDAIWGLTLTYILVPWPFFLASIVLLWKFPITRERQTRIRRLIERRAARAAPAE